MQNSFGITVFVLRYSCSVSFSRFGANSLQQVSFVIISRFQRFVNTIFSIFSGFFSSFLAWKNQNQASFHPRLNQHQYIVFGRFSDHNQPIGHWPASRIFSTTAPPKQRCPSYKTALWPGVTALWGVNAVMFSLSPQRVASTS